MGQVPTASKVSVLKREIAVRKNVYPKLVARNEMEQQEADYQIEVMEAILADYERRAKDERHPKSP
jgi:hypothetical protein